MKLHTKQTHSLVIYTVIPPIRDIIRNKNFIIPLLSGFALIILIFNNVLQNVFWIIGMVITTVYLIQLIRSRNTVKIELNTNSRELRYQEINEKSDWKLISKNGRILHVVNIEDITYLYPNERLAKRDHQYEANLEIQDEMGAVKFHVYRMSRNIKDIHWISQLALNLAEILNLEHQEDKDRIVKTEHIPFKGTLYGWLVRDRSRSEWD